MSTFYTTLKTIVSIRTREVNGRWVAGIYHGDVEIAYPQDKCGVRLTYLIEAAAMAGALALVRTMSRSARLKLEKLPGAL
jgi:hypothetical protein